MRAEPRRPRELILQRSAKRLLVAGKGGRFPSLGSNTEEHLQNILTTGELSATLEDTKTGKILATVELVKIALHNNAINARGIVGQDVTFNAIRLRDESEVQPA